MCTMLSALIIWSIAHSHVLITAAPQAMLARRRIHNGHNKGIFLALLVSKRLLQCWQHSELVASANFATLFDWSAKLLINGIILFPPSLSAPWPSANKQCLKAVAEGMCNFPLHFVAAENKRAEGSKTESYLRGFLWNQSWPKPWSSFGCLTERLPKYCFAEPLTWSMIIHANLDLVFCSPIISHLDYSRFLFNLEKTPPKNVY